MSEDLNEKKPRLTPKQQRFVAATSQGMSASDAVIAAGYNVSTRNSAEALGSMMLAQPKIQNALSASIQRQFPNVPDMAANTLVDILINPEGRPGDKLKAIELLCRICGWQAPSAHASLNVSVSDKFKLPEE